MSNINRYYLLPIVLNLDKREITCGLFTDYTKAFSLGRALEWFRIFKTKLQALTEYKYRLSINDYRVEVGGSVPPITYL